MPERFIFQAYYSISVKNIQQFFTNQFYLANYLDFVYNIFTNPLGKDYLLWA